MIAALGEEFTVGNVVTILTIIISIVSTYWKLKNSVEIRHVENSQRMTNVDSAVKRIERKVDEVTEETKQGNKDLAKLSNDMNAHSQTDKIQFDNIREALKDLKG